MTNGDKIRNMPDDELNKFLWWFKIEAITSFFRDGGAAVMDAQEQGSWLQSQDNTFLDKLMMYSEE